MIYRFGRFTLDALVRRLTRDGAAVAVSDRHLDVLLRLLASPGQVVAKDALVQAAWPDVAVTDNSLEQAISILRRTLADDATRRPAAGQFPESDAITIETIPRRGYRLTGDVRCDASRHSDAELDGLLAPHRAWLEGRAALETLSVQKVERAERAFRSVLEASPDHAPAHVGLASALVFRFEASRVDEHPDLAALADGALHARDACRLQPAWAEAWATLALLLHRAGQIDEGIAAARRSVELEPDNWRHHLRLAFISWGEARLRAAQRTLQLMPGLALAHWLAASVHIARQALAAADQEIALGTAAQDQQVEGAMFAGVGLHWIAGLLRLRSGDERVAEHHFARELAFEDSGHLYARECCAATWYARGAAACHRGDRLSAAAAFDEVLRRVPRHPFALAASAAAGVPRDRELAERLRTASDRGAHVDVAVAGAIRQTAGSAEPDAAGVLGALQRTPPGPSGWYLPVEPMLRPAGKLERWRPILSLVRSRAS